MYSDSNVKKFKDSINLYEIYGTYTASFDNMGDIVLGQSSSNFNQTFISIPMQSEIYNNENIVNIYNVAFEQFTQITKSVSTTNVAITNSPTNTQLQLQVNTLLSASNASAQYSSQITADKAQIISLRVQLGQGTTSANFSNIFPYLPLSGSVI